MDKHVYDFTQMLDAKHALQNNRNGHLYLEKN